MTSPLGSIAISSGSGPDSSWRETSSVLVSMTSMMSPSPAATNSSLPSGLTTMPRGRRATLMVLTTSSVSPFSTVMVLSFSLETKIAAAKDGAAKRRSAAAEPAARRMRCMCLPLADGLFELALGLGLIEAKRVGDVGGVEEAFLRRGRDGHAGAAAEHDRLPHLVVPGAEAHRLAFEAFQLELVGEHVGLHLLRRGLARLHRRIGKSTKS